MSTQKNKIISIILLIIVIITVAYGALTQDARATVEEYEIKIEENNQQIQQVENIKDQLHILATLLRDNEEINNEFDKILSQKWHECNDYLNNKLNENTNLQDKIKEISINKKLVGKFKITHYCPCTTCNGSWGNKTASGTIMTPYKTIAVDPKVIPLGSRVEISGETYIAEDTGGAIKGNRIDVCVGSHSEAYQRGVLYDVPVYIVY